MHPHLDVFLCTVFAMTERQREMVETETGKHFLKKIYCEDFPLLNYNDKNTKWKFNFIENITFGNSEIVHTTHRIGSSLSLNPKKNPLLLTTLDFRAETTLSIRILPSIFLSRLLCVYVFIIHGELLNEINANRFMNVDSDTEEFRRRKKKTTK